MKKLALALAFLMILPGAAFGLEMMNDSALDDVSGQSGVSIALDDLQVFMNIERVAWIDCSGFKANPTDFNTDTGEITYDHEAAAGAVGISNFQIDVLNINAPDTAVAKSGGVWDLTTSNPASQIDLKFNYGDTGTSGSCVISTAYATSQLTDSALTDLGTQSFGLNNYQSVNDPLYTGSDARYIPAALTIDATSQLPVISTAKSTVLYDGATTGVNQGGVVIGVPTLEIYIPSLSMTPAFYNVDGAAEASNDVDGADGVYGSNGTFTDDANYGTIALEGVTVTTLSGWIEIAPH